MIYMQSHKFITCVNFEKNLKNSSWKYFFENKNFHHCNKFHTLLLSLIFLPSLSYRNTYILCKIFKFCIIFQ